MRFHNTWRFYIVSGLQEVSQNTPFQARPLRRCWLWLKLWQCAALLNILWIEMALYKFQLLLLLFLLICCWSLLKIISISVFWELQKSPMIRASFQNASKRIWCVSYVYNDDDDNNDNNNNNNSNNNNDNNTYSNNNNGDVWRKMWHVSFILCQNGNFYNIPRRGLSCVTCMSILQCAYWKEWWNA